MLVMIESITAKIKYNQSDRVATWVYVDEMHELWGEEYSLHALEKMWREVRKRGGICTGMRQYLIEAQRNRTPPPMVYNSEYEPEPDRCTEKPFYEINGFQLRIYAFAGSGNNG